MFFFPNKLWIFAQWRQSLYAFLLPTTESNRTVSWKSGKSWLSSLALINIAILVKFILLQIMRTPVTSWQQAAVENEW